MSRSYRSRSTIMVVEDSDDVRFLLRRWLEKNGYQVVEATNGKDALERATEQCPDLILMDLNLPVLDGLAATEQIRACRAACKMVPILAVTAHDTYGMKQAALDAGCDDYLVKPIDFNRLDQMLRRMLISC